MALLAPARYTSSDWFHCIQSLPQSKILQRTKWNILCTTTWAAAVVLVFKLAFSPTTNKFVKLPTSVHSVLGSALGLLLVFRTNTAYDRFHEARKAQSVIVQNCRTIASLGYTHLPKRLHATLAALLTCFVCVQRQHLQGVINHDEITALSPFLQSSGPSTEAAGLLSTLQTKRNRPIFLIRVLEKFIYDGLVAKYADPGIHPDTAPKYIEKHLTEATNSLGAQLAACERILKQPVPSQYSRHSSRFLRCVLLWLREGKVSWA
jgi:predicted membrane chloride channel (bestrophin family)